MTEEDIRTTRITRKKEVAPTEAEKIATREKVTASDVEVNQEAGAVTTNVRVGESCRKIYKKWPKGLRNLLRSSKTSL